MDHRPLNVEKWRSLPANHSAATEQWKQWHSGALGVNEKMEILMKKTWKATGSLIPVIQRKFWKMCISEMTTIMKTHSELNICKVYWQHNSRLYQKGEYLICQKTNFINYPIYSLKASLLMQNYGIWAVNVTVSVAICYLLYPGINTPQRKEEEARHM